MKPFSKNPDYSFHEGSTIVGKWHKKHYRIIKKLGQGANGTVYLAIGHVGEVAVKISTNMMAITSEVNVLKQLTKVQGQHLGPCLLDIDDYRMNQQLYHFYVMEYIKGEPYFSFLKVHQGAWEVILICQLLQDLGGLHQLGFVFGDLKPDNLIVTNHPPRIRLLDVGGTTQFGRSVKEFTELYDRGYWTMGNRVAEPTYDLFSVAIIMIQTFSMATLKKGDHPKQQLKEIIETKPSLIPYKGVIEKALLGKYEDAYTMKKELLDAYTGSHKQVQPAQRRTKKRKRSFHVVETGVICTILLLIYVFYLFKSYI